MAAFRLIVLALAWLSAGRVIAQPDTAKPDTAALPSVIYPIRGPANGPPDASPPGVAPQAPLPIVEGPPVRYVLVDGVWGD